MRYNIIIAILISNFLVSANSYNNMIGKNKKTLVSSVNNVDQKVNEFAKVPLDADLTYLTPNQKQIIPILIKVADIMDNIFWKQTFGSKDSLLNYIEDANLKQFVEINYGPWENFNNNESFISGIGKKPLGSRFYPEDMTDDEFEKLNDERKNSWYSIIVRDKQNNLQVISYGEAYKEELKKASDLLLEASKLCEDIELKKYFELRSKALLTDDYLESDLAWMDMKNNVIDFVVGPIEQYEDALYGTKTAYSGQILVKDIEWSNKLSKINSYLQNLQKTLPVDDKYKTEKVNDNSDINVYNLIYSAGDCNSGGKNIAINLPNDPRVHEKKGTRKLQLKNAIKAKFDKILLPISNILIAEEQRKYIKFDAFFENVMFHEIAHGMGIKNTINGKGTAREALKATYQPIEEGKADILGLYLITKLTEMGEMGEKDLMDNYVTFMAGIFRSVRFGAASPHGKANMIRFNYFQECKAFTRDSVTGLYKVNFEKMKEAVVSLSKEIIIIQGNGDVEAAQKLIDEKGNIKEELQKDLDKIAKSGIPRDIVYEQGLKYIKL